MGWWKWASRAICTKQSAELVWNNRFVATASKSDLYRLIPSVDELLKSPGLALLLSREGQPAVAESVRAVITGLRD